MTGDDAARLVSTEVSATLQQCISDKMAALHAVKKKAVEAHACVRVIALLLEEEHAFVATLEADAVTTAL
jgi:hypothetical protein